LRDGYKIKPITPETLRSRAGLPYLLDEYVNIYKKSTQILCNIDIIDYILKINIYFQGKLWYDGFGEI